ncbi:MAG: 6-phospho-beta-glucosidase [Bacillota bacterium]|nr:MAG: 6-phospho-beta-glucosidase [Bacillota bacterium]
MKIAIIGGASAFTPGIIEGLFVEEAILDGAEVCLMDIDEEKLAIVADLAAQIIRARGAQYTITHTSNRVEALRGADYVLTQVRVGGLAARALDERIPLQHNVIGQETTGAGGLSFAWRSIPFLLEVAADMRRHCPQAYLVNYSNPTGQVVRALLSAGFEKVVAICDEPSGVQYVLSKLMLTHNARLEIDNVGINHCGWLTAVRRDGSDKLPMLRSLSTILQPIPGLVGRMSRLFKEYGYFPSPYLFYYYLTEEMLREQLAAKQTRADIVVEKLPRIYAHYKEQAASAKPRLRLRRGVPGHGDLAVRVIASLAANRGDRIIVNGLNKGALSFLPADAIVEVPALVGKEGAQLLPMSGLPEQIAELIIRVEKVERLNVEAALKGDFKLAVEAMRLHPLVDDEKKAESLVRELIAAHKPWLPQF